MMERFGLRAIRACALAATLAGCGGSGAHPTAGAQAPQRPGGASYDQHVPAFATRPYEPFLRQSVVGIALREWRLFGQPVDDDPPGSRPPPLPQDKPERQPGLWQRVGEYWWIGLDPGQREAAWTGKHDEYGTVFPASQDGQYAWSAAFVSYVMRIAGAGQRFPYSESHSTYINAALGPGFVVQAQPPEAYGPRLGDLICTSRTPRPLRYADLPRWSFPAHCDIVVGGQPGQISVIGGNVDDAVTLKHVPTTPEGLLATPDGTVLDTRYPWFVVLRVLYDADQDLIAALP